MKRTRRRRLTYAAVATIALGIAAVALVPRWLGPKVAVVHPVRSDLVQTVVTTGRVMAPAEIGLSAELSATVKEVHVDKGDRVKKGDLLVRLDERDAKVAVLQAKAALARARAQRRQVHSVSAPVLDQSLAQAEARREEAARRQQENAKLFASGAISKSELDRAQTQLELADSQLSAAKTQARAASPGGADSATASAAIEQAEAEVRAAEVRLERTEIRAPVDGVILSRSVEPGELATAGRTLLVLARTGLTQLVIEPDEKNLSLLQVGQLATASAEAFSDRTFRGRLSFIAPSIDPKRGTVEVRLEVAKPPSYLRPQMTVSVEVEVAKRKDALVLDAGAVRDLAGESPWALVLRDGRAQRADLKLGIRGDRRVEILAGIDMAAAVIPPSEARVAPGSRVRPAGG